MKHKLLTKKEEERAIIQILDVLLDKSVPFSGKHRQSQWEKGWSQNTLADIVPKYFGKHKINRLNGRLVWGMSKEYEVNMLYSLVDKLAIKYLRGLSDVYEFGCGTGHNLLRIQAVSPRSILHGFDWTRSSNELVKAMGFHAENFDYFNPPEINLRPDSGVYTVASLEQIGTKYKKFVNYLLEQKPRVVVHIEPIPELLDPTNLLDYLSIAYMKKRKYLSGYLDYLKGLEKQGKITIHEACRSGIGSFLIDGYSLVIWSPK